VELWANVGLILSTPFLQALDPQPIEQFASLFNAFFSLPKKGGDFNTFSNIVSIVYYFKKLKGIEVFDNFVQKRNVNLFAIIRCLSMYQIYLQFLTLFLTNILTYSLIFLTFYLIKFLTWFFIYIFNLHKNS
jgi:hypothetical protein